MRFLFSAFIVVFALVVFGGTARLSAPKIATNGCEESVMFPCDRRLSVSNDVDQLLARFVCDVSNRAAKVTSEYCHWFEREISVIDTELKDKFAEREFYSKRYKELKSMNENFMSWLAIVCGVFSAFACIVMPIVINRMEGKFAERRMNQLLNDSQVGMRQIWKQQLISAQWMILQQISKIRRLLIKSPNVGRISVEGMGCLAWIKIALRSACNTNDSVVVGNCINDVVRSFANAPLGVDVKRWDGFVEEVGKKVKEYKFQIELNEIADRIGRESESYKSLQKLIDLYKIGL